jgi:hypothetical protein
MQLARQATTDSSRIGSYWPNRSNDVKKLLELVSATDDGTTCWQRVQQFVFSLSLGYGMGYKTKPAQHLSAGRVSKEG